MSMHRIMAAQARSVVGQFSQFGAPRCGLVSSFNPQTYCAKVLIQPENTLTGWLPILSFWVGPGWGCVAPLPLGVQVLVLPDRNDAQQGVISGVLYSDVDTPPNSAAAGEILLLHQSGSFVTLKNDGSVDINAPAGLNITGNVKVTGTITASGDVIGAGISLSNHEHPYFPGTGGSTLTGKGQG
ncbi:MAG TPA: baseplate assembly protein [Acidocella sp.]|nr:baseplate assembly protein [Acidocella sp.]